MQFASGFAFVGILGTHRERDSAACGELRCDDCLARRACVHEIVENTVRDRFIERALIPIRGEIKLERFALDAQAVRHIIDIDPGEVRLARDRTNGSEIIRFKMNPVIPPRRIWESLEPRLRGRRGNP